MEPLKTSILPDETVFMEISGDLNHEVLPIVHKALQQSSKIIEGAYKNAGKKLLCLIDLTHFSETREVKVIAGFADFATHNRPFIKKTACFGNNLKAALAVETISALAKRENIHFFRTKEEALAALKTA